MCAVQINAETARWARRYHKALRQHLAHGPGAGLRSALGLGRQAATLGLETLDLAGIHKQALLELVSEGASMTGPRMLERARRFFAETIVPIEKTHGAAMKASACVDQLTRTLRRRMGESSASNICLKRSIRLRQGAEESLKKSGQRQGRLLAELHRLQKRLRDLTHASVSLHEDERRRMSVRLHDEIAQALIAVDLRLLTLKKSARSNTESLKKKIAETQRLVKESVKRVDRFANEYAIQHKA